MGQNPATKYTEEFLRETADYTISSGRPITECCKELGLNSKTVSTWVVKRRRELGRGRRRRPRGHRGVLRRLDRPHHRGQHERLLREEELSRRQRIDTRVRDAAVL